MVNYIDNKRFEDLIFNYTSGDKSVESELFEMFDTLITRLMTGYNFTVDFEEAKQECFLLLLKVLRNFKKEKGAAFNYCTTIILNNLRLIYSKAKKYREKIKSYTEIKTGNYSASSDLFEIQEQDDTD